MILEKKNYTGLVHVMFDYGLMLCLDDGSNKMRAGVL
jgi:hypothetical protein